MEYAIEVLKYDLQNIEKALIETRAWTLYPNAYKRQINKTKELKKAIEKLESYKS